MSQKKTCQQPFWSVYYQISPAKTDKSLEIATFFWFPIFIYEILDCFKQTVFAINRFFYLYQKKGLIKSYVVFIIFFHDK